MDYKSHLAKILGSSYKELDGYSVIDIINKELKQHEEELTPNQVDILKSSWARDWGRLPFYAFVWSQEKRKKPSILMRLSSIPLGLWLLLLIIFRPIKWIITGDSTYTSSKNRIGKFTANWINKTKYGKKI